MQKSFKILLFSIVLMIGFNSCKQNPPQRPTVYSNDGFLEYSKKFNKQLKDSENQEIQTYIQNQKEDFLQTNAGFFMTRTAMDVRKVRDLDSIRFTYQVSNLKDSIIYNYADIGRRVMVLGKASIIPGLEYGLKRMGEGEAATLILPSALAYGVNGDKDKIGTDQPLILNVKLEDIINYEK